MSIQLKDVVDVLLKVDDDTNVWYDRKADQLKWHSPYAGDIDDEGAQTDREQCVNLPSRYEINDYRLMELFIKQLEDGDAKSHLAASIVGRGAFRRFRGTCERYDLTKRWNDFREACYISFAEKWCEKNNVPYVPYESVVPDFQEADFDLYDDEAFHITLADHNNRREEEENTYPIEEVPLEDRKILEPLAVDPREMKNENVHVAAASDNGTYAGFIAVANGIVVDLYVQRKYRRNGLGKALVKEAEKRYGNLQFHVEEPDFQARSFLKSCGYHVKSVEYTK